MASAAAVPMMGYGDTQRGEAALVEAARSDARAFAELYEGYEARIYRYMRARTPSPEDAADLTQQVFLRALEAIPRYRERGLPFAAWLFRIARNIVADYHRRRRDTVAWDLVPEELQPVAEDDVEAAVLRDERLVLLRTILAELDEDRRELIALRFVARLTQAEIGAVVGKSEEAVRKQLARTLAGLKERYREQG